MNPSTSRNTRLCDSYKNDFLNGIFERENQRQAKELENNRKLHGLTWHKKHLDASYQRGTVSYKKSTTFCRVGLGSSGLLQRRRGPAVGEGGSLAPTEDFTLYGQTLKSNRSTGRREGKSPTKSRQRPQTALVTGRSRRHPVTSVPSGNTGPPRRAVGSERPQSAIGSARSQSALGATRSRRNLARPSTAGPSRQATVATYKPPLPDGTGARFGFSGTDMIGSSVVARQTAVARPSTSMVEEKATDEEKSEGCSPLGKKPSARPSTAGPARAGVAGDGLSNIAEFAAGSMRRGAPRPVTAGSQRSPAASNLIAGRWRINKNGGERRTHRVLPLTLNEGAAGRVELKTMMSQSRQSHSGLLSRDINLHAIQRAASSGNIHASRNEWDRLRRGRGSKRGGGGGGFSWSGVYKSNTRRDMERTASLLKRKNAYNPW